MAEELVNFLTNHDALVAPVEGRPRRYDLVLDKSGSGFLPSYEVARTYFDGIMAVMEPGGLYVYIIARDQYYGALGQRFAKWPKPWIGLAEEYLEPVVVDDDEVPNYRGYVRRAFRRR
jgi:hypothetical protein